MLWVSIQKLFEELWGRLSDLKGASLVVIFTGVLEKMMKTLRFNEVNRAFKWSLFLGLIATMLTEPALAQVANQGLGGFVNTFKNDTLKPLLEFGVYVAYAAGVGVTGVGINKFIKVSKGDPQTGPGEAAAYTFGGGGLMALGLIADYAANSMSVNGTNPAAWGTRSAADVLQSLLPFIG